MKQNCCRNMWNVRVCY